MSLLTRTPVHRDPEEPPHAVGAPTGKQKRTRGRGRTAAAPAPSSVNLLSQWVLDELHVRRLRVRFVVGAVVLLLVVAAGWGLLRLDLSRAQDDLRADESIGASLSSQITGLGDVKTYVGNVAIRSVMVEKIMQRQIAHAAVMDGLERALPEGAALTAVSVALPPNPETLPPGATVDQAPTLCPGPDPFGTVEVVGCVTISGTAESRAAVSELVQSLSRSGLFIEPFIDSSTTGDEDGPAIQFTGSLGLSEKTYTGRFSDVADPGTAYETTDGGPR